MITPSNTFSFSRFVAVARFYLRSLYSQLLVYTLVSLLCFAAILYVGPHGQAGIALIGFLSFMLGCMYSFGAVALTRRSDQDIEALMPATGLEKTIFFVLYTVVILGLIIYVPNWLDTYLLQRYYPDCDFIQSQKVAESLVTKTSIAGIVSAISSIVPPLACLLAVMWYRRNRALLGMIWSVVSIFAIGVISGAFVVFHMVGYLRQLAASNVDVEIEINGAEMFDMAANTINDALPYVGALCLIATIILIYLLYRRVSFGTRR